MNIFQKYSLCNQSSGHVENKSFNICDFKHENIDNMIFTAINHMSNFRRLENAKH